MSQTTGKIQTKNGENSDRDYSIKCVQRTCTITYKGRRKDRRILKCVPLIKRFGKNAVQATGLLSSILGPSIIILAGPDLLDNLYGWIPFITVSALLFSSGIVLFDYVKYVEATKCKKCDQEYAYEEREKPDITETITEGSYAATITRYWKCKYCGFVDSTESSENIKTRKGEEGKPKEIECEKCGKTGVSSECRNPDTKTEIFSACSITTKTMYYRCEYCGHVNIEVEKIDVTNADGTPSIFINT